MQSICTLTVVYLSVAPPRPFYFYNGKGLAIANPDNTLYN